MAIFIIYQGRRNRLRRVCKVDVRGSIPLVSTFRTVSSCELAVCAFSVTS